MTTPIAERAAGQSAELVQLYRDFELRTLDYIVVGGGTAGCVLAARLT